MAEELAPGVWFLDLGLIRPVETNCYLVDDGEVTLIDTGLWWNRPSMDAELAEAGYTPTDVDRVLLTHYDLDHTTGLRHLPGFEGPIYIGEADYDLYTGASDPPLIHHKGLFHRLVRPFFPLPRDADVRPVADGERIGNFTAYHTPGHNPGHLAYVHDSGAAFVGDLLWEDDGELTPPFWLDCYDTTQLRESIVAFAGAIPDVEVMGMGHGTPIRTGAHRLLDDLAARL
ncbi:MBL fold metallo-hydrolase [Halapricum salinum]|uniref:MBL fold metallo-hydrolase n=1 Tax=Halapricum salinum TaxID=1457250 RepID=A0A4D6HGF9_9EURY|nr:MBL fold metallo-hydrolase [Halapricum salinum]QCC52306.1 MBL fold metallo-hydrolase [Halapricum salinum]